MQLFWYAHALIAGLLAHVSKIYP